MIAGRGPAPSLVLALIQRLPDTSMTAAIAQGGPQFLGWGIDRYLAAETFDALNVNTKATGQWKKGKVPDFPAWPRPSTKPTTDEGKPRVTVADLYQRFTRRK